MTRPEMERRGGWWLMFYVSLGLGFLAKGPLAWLPIGGLLLGRCLMPAAFRLKPLEMLAGLILSLLIVSAWGIPALVATNGEFFRIGIGRHVVQRSVGVLEGHGGKNIVSYVVSLPLYLVTFFFSFFPWAAFVAFGMSTGSLIRLLHREHLERRVDGAQEARHQLSLRGALLRSFEKDQATVSRPASVRFNGHSHRVIMSIRPRAEVAGNSRSGLATLSCADSVFSYLPQNVSDYPAGPLQDLRYPAS